MHQKAYIVVKALIRKGDEFLILKKAGANDSNPIAGWETPGGHAEEKETPQQALRREVFEETNIKIIPMYPFNIFSIQMDPENIEVGINYFARFESGEPVISAEHSMFRWATIKQIRALTESNGLQKEIDGYENFLKNALEN